MEDWAEVHRLFHREGLAEGGHRPAARHEPQYRRPAARPGGAAPLRAGAGRLAARPVRRRHRGHARRGPAGPATVVRERLRAHGYRGGITILKEHLARVRPGFLAARAFQRTTYEPGGIGQVDWWHTGARCPSAAAHPRGLRPRDHAALVGRPRRGLHPGADGGRPAPGARGLPRAPGRRARGARVRQRRLGRRVARGRPGPAAPRGRGAPGRPAPGHRAAPGAGPPRRAASSARSATSRRASCRCAPSAR